MNGLFSIEYKVDEKKPENVIDDPTEGVKQPTANVTIRKRLFGSTE